MVIGYAILALFAAGCFSRPEFAPGGVPDDGSVDASVVDGACNLAPIDELLTFGNWYSVDAKRQRGVKIAADAVMEIEGDVDSNVDATFVQVLVPKPNGVSGYSAVRLAPGGDELFVRRHLTTTDGYEIVRSVRVDGVWSAQEPIKFSDELGTPLDISVGDTVSAPTTTTPRRLVMSTTYSIVEFVELDSTHWRRLRTMGLGELGVTSGVDHATLDASGLRLVFLAYQGLPGNFVHRSDRTDLAVPFPTSTRIIDLTLDVRATPFLAEDCQRHLYYSVGGYIHHQILP